MRQRRISRLPWLGRAAITNIQPIGFVSGSPVYPICGADGEGSGSGGEGGSGSSGSGEGGEGGDPEGEKEEKPPKDPKEYESWVKIRDLSRENARRRVAAKEANDKWVAAQEELEALKAKDMSDLEKANTALARSQKTNEELTATLDELRIENAFLKIPKDKYNWADPGAALTLLMAEYRGDLTLHDDGTVDGLDKAVKDLSKKYKFLISSAVTAGGSGEGGEGNGTTGGSYGDNGDRGSGDARKQFQDKAASRFTF